MKKDELEKLIEETQEAEPAQTTLDILQYVKKHRALVLNEFGKYIKYFEDYFDVLNMEIKALNYSEKKAWPNHKRIQYLMFPETLKTLHRAFEDIVDGYYDEATMLLRSVYETYIKIIFLSSYPENWHIIFFSKKGEKKFNLTNFVEVELKLDWKFMYRAMSHIYHAKTYRNFNRIVEMSQGKHSEIALKYDYNEKDISMPLNISTFLLYALFHFALISFGKDLGNINISNDKILRINKIDKALRGIMDASRNSFSHMGIDIDKIDLIISGKKSIQDITNAG